MIFIIFQGAKTNIVCKKLGIETSLCKSLRKAFDFFRLVCNFFVSIFFVLVFFCGNILGDPARYPNLKTARSVTRSVETVLLSHKWNGYGPSSGLHSTKEAIARKFSFPENVPNMNESDVFLTVGCSDALHISMCSILDENDKNHTLTHFWHA